MLTMQLTSHWTYQYKKDSRDFSSIKFAELVVKVSVVGQEGTDNLGQHLGQRVFGWIFGRK